MTTPVEVWVDGHPLSTVCFYSDLSWTTRWPYGDWEASWTIHVPQGWRHPAFTRGKTVRITYAGVPLWLGDIGDCDWDSGQMHADGRIRRGESYQALHYDTDSTSIVPTRIPRVAVDDAITPPAPMGRPPIQWKRPDNSLPNVPVRTSDDDLDAVSILDLLDAATSRGWGTPYMGPYGNIRLLQDPSASTLPIPTRVAWQVWPKTVDVGDAGGPERATRIFVTFMQASTLSWRDDTSYSPGDIVLFKGDLFKRRGSGAGDVPQDGSAHWTKLDLTAWDPDAATASYNPGVYYVSLNGSIYTRTVGGTTAITVNAPPGAGWTLLGSFPTPGLTQAVDSSITPYREVTLDATSLGDLPAAEATDIAEQALAEGVRPIYDTDIPLTPFTAANGNGSPINPLMARAGQLGRVWGAKHPHLGQQFIDVIAGEVQVTNADTRTPSAVVKPYNKPARGLLEVMEAALNARRNLGLDVLKLG